MKTDVYIPNSIFNIAKKLALDLNISLGELYTLAITDYITASKSKNDITSQLNEVYKDEESSIDLELMSMQVSSIGGESW